MTDLKLPPEIRNIADRLAKHIVPNTVTSIGEVTRHFHNQWGGGNFRNFEFRYGLRIWNKYIYRPDEHKPDPVAYKTELEKIAVDAKAMNLRAQLAELYAVQTDCPLEDVTEPLDYVIIVDGVDITLAMRMFGGEGPLLNYLVIDDQLVDNQNQGNRYDTDPFRAGVLAPLSPGYPKLTLAEQVRLLFSTPHQNSDEAERRLGKALLQIFDRLSNAGNRVAVASSANRFNDAAGDIDWQAVNVDGAAWDNGTYFQHTAEKLSGLPPAIDVAIGVLMLSQSIGLRDMLHDYLGEHVSCDNDILILSVDERGMHVCFAPSNGGGGPVYKVDTTGLPILAGRANEDLDREMERLGNGRDYVVTFTPIDSYFSSLKGRLGSSGLTYLD